MKPDIKRLGDQAARKRDQTLVSSPRSFALVVILFFLIGGILSLNDLITPKLKSLFELSYTRAMLVNVCFFLAYGLVSIPAAQLVMLFGYLRGAVIGLVIMCIGCLLFIPATELFSFSLFLFALIIVASGNVIVQVVLNPLVSSLGSPDAAHTRLTLAQAFNSLGMVSFPLLFGTLILGSSTGSTGGALDSAASDAYRVSESHTVLIVYLSAAAALAAVATVIWSNRNQLQGERHAISSIRQSLELLRIPRFAFGALCICLYVGAEISLASVLVNYAQLPRVLGISAAEAAGFVPCYWGAAFLGRSIGALLLTRTNPGKALSTAAFGALMLIGISINSSGLVAIWSFVAVGLMNAIMFPTIFSLACKELGDRAAEGSGLINVAVCGGAIVTLSTGRIADLTGSLTLGLAVPSLCYCGLASFGWFNRGR